MPSIESVIQEYLENYCNENEIFKAAYSKKGRTIEKCIAYIVEQASKEQRVNNCAMVENAKVFHWAREYYENEEDIAEPKITKAKQVEIKTVEEPKATKPKKKKAKEVKEENRISLFDLEMI